ncbi:MAG: RnfH family protein [Burkholderiales bacterium]|nr:RnfH family protein [Burkholderiales bacterium]PZN36904.1 MAG: RnfH family protein [Pseudomonadota bacterium]
MNVEVVYALPERQAVYRLAMEEGATVRMAIEASGVLQAFPEIDLARNRVGVYARLVTLDTPLRDGDRVEIYRPLRVDPKEARRMRAEARRRK